MINQNNQSADPRGSATTPSDGSGQASGKHQGLHRPGDDQRVEDALENVGLEDRGAVMEDHLRDRRGKGVAGGYDDSIDHDIKHDEGD